MRILLDLTQIPVNRTGVGVYAEHLVCELANILDPEDTLFVLAQDDDPLLGRFAAMTGIKFLLIPSRIFRNRIALAAYEQLVMPLVCIRHRIDLVHSLHYTFPLLAACARVVTVHDLTFFLYPELHTRGRRIAMRLFTKAALRWAEGILFVSESTRKDAERLLGTGKNVRVVAPLGIDIAAYSQVPQSQSTDTLRRFQIVEPYILFVGTIEPRKNLVRLIEAFARVGGTYPNHTLVFAGKLGWHSDPLMKAVAHSPFPTRIRMLGYVSLEDKIGLLARCEALIYPSLYEGFGLPVLEGMAAGVPVICGDSSSLPELAGNGAVTVNAENVEELSDAIVSVLSNPTYRRFLAQSGLEQAHKFCWTRTAELTYSAYRSCVASVHRT